MTSGANLTRHEFQRLAHHTRLKWTSSKPPAPSCDGRRKHQRISILRGGRFLPTTESSVQFSPPVAQYVVLRTDKQRDFLKEFGGAARI
jgi:hypothetical protein